MLYERIWWNHFSPHTDTDALQLRGQLAVGAASIKVGVSGCPYWRFFNCEGHGGGDDEMRAHYCAGWENMFVITCDWGDHSDRLEEQLICLCKEDVRTKDKCANVKAGGDGYIKRREPTFVYIVTR